MASQKFKGLKITNVGLGGTGAYILDLVSKSPVEDIPSSMAICSSSTMRSATLVLCRSPHWNGA